MVRGLDRLVGLCKEKTLARIDIAACTKLKETFPHTLLFGEGGLGKTDLARAIAEELGYPFIEKEAASLNSRRDIIELLAECNRRSLSAGRPFLLFLDEIHQLTVRKQEVLYFPMTERRVDLGEGNWMLVEPFTLFAATTKLTKGSWGLESERLDIGSFVTRFPNQWLLEPYHILHIVDIIVKVLRGNGCVINHREAMRLGMHCGGIPRTAVRLAHKVRYHAAASNRSEVIDRDITNVLALELGV